jgi:hypothetical protein
MSSYTEKVRRIKNTSLAAYWPMNEYTGTTAFDLGSQWATNGENGTYTACTLASRYAPDGSPAPYFDGSTSKLNVYVAASEDSTLAGTVSAWFMCEKDYLDGTTLGRIFSMGVDANNVVLLEKTATANTLRAAYIAGGTTDHVSPTLYTQGPNQYGEWHHIAMTYSVTDDALIVYLDGAKTGSTQSTLGTWSGSVASTIYVIGASATTPSNVFKGWIAHVAQWTSVLTADEISELAKIGL